MNTTPATNTGGAVGPAAVDTVIIGAGQSGLALGYYLAQQHRDFVILDAGTRVGDADRDLIVALRHWRYARRWALWQSRGAVGKACVLMYAPRK